MLSTDTNPRISVVIPSYNRAELLVRAIKSVLAQQDTPAFEIIVSDDGSTDETLALIHKTFAQEISQNTLRVLANSHSGDPAVARNKAAALAQGEYLAFLDSDDYWLPTRLAELAAVLGSAEICLSPLKVDLTPSRDWLREYLIVNRGSTPSFVVRKSFFEKLGGYPENYFGPHARFAKGFEDYELYLKALALLWREGRRKAFVPLPSTNIIIEDHGGAGSMQTSLQHRREFFTRLRILRFLPLSYWPLALRRLLGSLRAMILHT